MGKKIHNGLSPIGTASHYLAKLLKIWFFWVIFYLLFPFPTNLPDNISIMDINYMDALSAKLNFFIQNPTLLLIDGGAGHLWFFPSLIIALLAVIALLNLNMSNIIMPISCIGYGLNLIFAGAYSEASLAETINNFSMSNFNISISHSVVIDYYCVSIFFVSLGWWFSTKEITLKPRYSLLIAGIGLAVYLLEFCLLGGDLSHSPGVVAYSVGLTLYAISRPDLGKDSLIAKWGRYSLGVYGGHLLFCQLLSPVDYALTSVFVWHIVFPISVYFLSLLLAMLLATNKWLRNMSMS